MNINRNVYSYDINYLNLNLGHSNANGWITEIFEFSDPSECILRIMTPTHVIRKLIVFFCKKRQFQVLINIYLCVLWTYSSFIPFSARLVSIDVNPFWFNNCLSTAICALLSSLSFIVVIPLGGSSTNAHPPPPAPVSFPARPTSEAADIITSSEACETPF